jgi:heptosyltransferase II
MPNARARTPLIVRLCNWVGEVVLAVPALKRLDTAGFDLVLVGKGWSKALLEGSGWRVLLRSESLCGASRQLRANRPARAILLTKSFSSALEARLAGLRTTGYAGDGRSLLLTEAIPRRKFEHAAHAYWYLVSRFLGADAPYPVVVELAASAAQCQQADAILATHQLTAGQYMLLCPFSGADDRLKRKVWPGFAELAGVLHERKVSTMVCPGPGEEAAAAALLPHALQLPGVNLGVYGALSARARAVVANDTGPGHLAAAMGARLISVYGPQSVPAWAPLGTHVELIHSPTGWPDVARVLHAALS